MLNDSDQGEVRGLHCTCSDGDIISVLVKDGEPHVEAHPTDPHLVRVVGVDGNVIVDSVKEVHIRRLFPKSAA